MFSPPTYDAGPTVDRLMAMEPRADLLLRWNPGQTDWGHTGTCGNPINTREPSGDRLMHGNPSKTGEKTGTQGRPSTCGLWLHTRRRQRRTWAHPGLPRASQRQGLVSLRRSGHARWLPVPGFGLHADQCWPPRLPERRQWRNLLSAAHTARRTHRSLNGGCGP